MKTNILGNQSVIATQSSIKSQTPSSSIEGVPQKQNQISDRPKTPTAGSSKCFEQQNTSPQHGRCGKLKHANNERASPRGGTSRKPKSDQQSKRAKKQSRSPQMGRAGRQSKQDKTGTVMKSPRSKSASPSLRKRKHENSDEDAIPSTSAGITCAHHQANKTHEPQPAKTSVSIKKGTKGSKQKARKPESQAAELTGFKGQPGQSAEETRKRGHEMESTAVTKRAFIQMSGAGTQVIILNQSPGHSILVLDEDDDDDEQTQTIRVRKPSRSKGATVNDSTTTSDPASTSARWTQNRPADDRGIDQDSLVSLRGVDSGQIRDWLAGMTSQRNGLSTQYPAASVPKRDSMYLPRGQYVYTTGPCSQLH